MLVRNRGAWQGRCRLPIHEGSRTVPNVRDDFMKNLDRIMPGDSEPAAVLTALQRMLLYADCRLQRITVGGRHDEDLI